MEAVTGRISLDEMEDEIANISRLLAQQGIVVVSACPGTGCDFEQVEFNSTIDVSTLLLAEFVEQQEELGIFTLGSNDLLLTGDGVIQFLLCEYSEIHCITDDAALFQLVCEHWAEVYPEAYEWDSERRLMRLFTGVQWISDGSTP
jgi:hypothetical protein